MKTLLRIECWFLLSLFLISFSGTLVLFFYFCSITDSGKETFGADMFYLLQEILAFVCSVGSLALFMEKSDKLNGGKTTDKFDEIMDWMFPQNQTSHTVVIVSSTETSNQ